MSLRFQSSQEYETQMPGNNARNIKLPPICIDTQAQCEYRPRALTNFWHSQKLFSTQSDFLVDLIVGPTQFKLSAENMSETFMWYMHDDLKNNVSSIGGRNATFRSKGERVHSIEPNSVILLTYLNEFIWQDGLFDIPHGGKLLSVKYNRL